MLENLTRRNAIKTVGAGILSASLASLAGPGHRVAAAEREETGPVPYELPDLPYPYDALEPQISEEILRIHLNRHHNAYVGGLNETLEKLESARREDDFTNIRALSRDLAFNCAGHVLHVLYWNSMTPGGSELPDGPFRDALERDFGSFGAFKSHFIAATTAVEANGWGLLGYEPLGRRLMVMQVENHQKLTTWGIVPLMTCDVWEHAYYLQYQNRRAEYVEQFMDIADWSGTARRFDNATG